jgi:uroporphyrinogen-III synthase
MQPCSVSAREAGFADVRSADGDVFAVGDLILAQLPADARLLHAANEGTRGDLAGRLAAAGVAADFVALFRAEPVAGPEPVLARHLAGEPVLAAILIHSPRAGEILADIVRSAANPAPLVIAAISAAAAAPLEGVARRIAIAEAPNETSLISALAGLVSG